MQNKPSIIDPFFPDCPVRNILAIIADKWSLLVMHTLASAEEPLRFSAIRRNIPDISQKMLTSTLRTLETNGFLSRKVFAEVPPRVEYALTDRALSFLTACKPMIEWAMTNFAAIIKDREDNQL